MSVELSIESHTWCFDARWVIYRSKPSQRTLKAHARKIGATHYALKRNGSWAAGFYTFADQAQVKSVGPTALAAAKYLGADAYAEFEIIPGKLWIIGTGPDGILLPFADTLISANDRQTFENRVSPKLLEHKKSFQLAAMGTVLDELEPFSINVTPVVSNRRFALMSAFAITGICVLLSLRAWHVHRQQIALQEAMERSANDKIIADAAKANLTVVMPNAYIKSCLNSVDKLRLYSSGWIVRDWKCDANALEVVWVRAGGTIASAPDGDADSRGDVVTSHIPLAPERVHPRQQVPTDGVRRFQALLQGAGIDADMRRSAPSAPEWQNTQHTTTQSPAVASTNFTWVTDPRQTDWDQVPRLHIASIHATTGLVNGDSTGKPGTYQINAEIMSGSSQ